MATATQPEIQLLAAPSPVVTSDQMALIKSTIAQGATDTELQLFFYDCKRQGVHPLDRLIHFTKRGGKYTPITSIDFMRQRAAQTGECAGIDDALYTGEPKTADFCASVTVYRLVQGQRSAFAASARWLEYKPEANDFMWRKMPFVMLGKCAEALALRKGFPQQLAGLYTTEELDQARDREQGDSPSLPSPISEAQRKRLFAIATKAGWKDKAEMRQELVQQFGVHETAAITLDQYEEICAWFEKPPQARETTEAEIDSPF
jgi:phage recombination protein Bet